MSLMERSQVVPNLYQTYYKDGDRDIVKEADDRYSMNLSPWQTYLYESTIDRKVYLGDQRYLSLYTGLSYEHQKYVFNASMSVVNMISGRQRQHRKGTQIIPVFNSSNKTATQLTKVLQGAYNIDDTYNKISECFKEGPLITGLSLMHSFIDYRQDPICGDLRTECLTPDMIMMDAYWREMDLSDCQFIRTRKYLHKNQVKDLLPGREHDIDMLNGQNYYDTKFTFMPQQYNIRRKDFLAYDEYWYQADRRATFIVDPETYESIEADLDKEDIENLRYRFPDVVIVKEKVPTVRLAIIVNNTCFYDGPNPMGVDMYPYTPFVGYHDKANNNYSFRYQGPIRVIRDSQYLLNYRTQLEMDLLAAQFSGVDVEEDALIDDQDAFKVGPGKVRFFKKNRLASIRDVPGANINPANFEVTQRLKNNIQSDAGVTPELLGLSDDNDVGITEKLRQDAGLMTLQELMDNLSLSQANAGKLHMALIQKNYTLGKIKRMIEEQPTNEFRDRSFQKYSAKVGFAPLTETTQQLSFIQKYTLWKDGWPIPFDQLIADVTIQDKDKLIQSVQQQQQQQQEQQNAMAKAQLENQQIVNNSLLKKADSDEALAQERMHKGRLEEMQIETQYNKAKHELASATLDAVKTAKEIDSMKYEDLEKVLMLIQNLQKPQDEASQKVG